MSKIAIIEDETIIADMYRLILENAGYDCVVANNGTQALQIIESSKPDLIMLDLLLPDISGDQVLTHMRKTDWGKDIKVVVMTNLSQEKVPIGLKRLGVSHYMYKADCMPKDIIKLVRSLIKQKA